MATRNLRASRSCSCEPPLGRIVLPSIIPAKLARSLEPFDDKDWLFELKHDGFRSLAYLENGHSDQEQNRRNVAFRFQSAGSLVGGLVRHLELKVDYFRGLPGARLEGALLSSAFSSSGQHRMTTDDTRSFDCAVRGYSHFNLGRACEIQLLGKLRD